MVTRTVERALLQCRRECQSPSRDWTGLCLQFARTVWGVPAKYPSAIDHWAHVPARMRHQDEAPPGALLHWSVGKFGHVAVSLGNGFCVGTDLERRGKADAHVSAQVGKRWGAEYLGWTDWCNGVQLPLR